MASDHPRVSAAAFPHSCSVSGHDSDLGSRAPFRSCFRSTSPPLCLFAVFAVAAGALVYAILQRHFDYDELEHAQAAWLIHRGAKPFYDFFECHPPRFNPAILVA